MIIIFEGFDKSGKTTLANLLKENYDFQYFRSSKQINSGINLEVSIKYDWRFFLDFLSQTKQNIIIDRSFISQWVYSIVLRNDSILKEYKNIGDYFDIFANYCHEMNKLEYLVVLCKRKNYNNVVDDEVNLQDNIKFNSTYEKFFDYFKINNLLICNYEDGIEYNLCKIKEKINVI